MKPDRTVEGERRLLMPGFFNAHAHLGMTIFRGYKDDVVLEEWLQDWIWPAEEELTPEEVYWGSKLALVEAIRSGTTAVADMYFNMDQTARSIEETGIRGLISYGLIAEDMDKAGEKELKEALELADEWDGSADGRIKVALSPHAPYTCGKEVLKEVSRLSRERGLPIHTHISETRGEVEESYEKFGVSPVKRLQDLGLLENPVLAAHCVHVNEEDVKTLKENDVVVAHNPTSNMKIASGAAPIEKMRQAGVDVTLGTDGPGTNNDLDIFEEMRQASFLAKLESDDPTALSAEDTLKIATASETDVLGFPGSGRIEEGAPADLIGVRRNPTYWTPEYDTVSNLVYSGKSREVDLVIADGEIVMEDGEIKTVDEREVINRVREIAEKYEKIRENKK
ncbi:MAG: amidohydrolase [Candidatus Acetothermia bacterium]